MLQYQKLVYFASKALTEAQREYVVIELESLTVAWTMEKFHLFLYASHFILETDQKPLEVILSKGINQATLRLQRILIRTCPYHFTIRYIPGLTNQLADCLLRIGGPKRHHQASQASPIPDHKSMEHQKCQLKPTEFGHARI